MLYKATFATLAVGKAPTEPLYEGVDFGDGADGRVERVLREGADMHVCCLRELS